MDRAEEVNAWDSLVGAARALQSLAGEKSGRGRRGREATDYLMARAVSAEASSLVGHGCEAEAQVLLQRHRYLLQRSQAAQASAQASSGVHVAADLQPTSRRSCVPLSDLVEAEAEAEAGMAPGTLDLWQRQYRSRLGLMGDGRFRRTNTAAIWMDVPCI